MSSALSRAVLGRILPRNGSLLFARFTSTNPQSGANVAYDSDGLTKIVKSDKVVVFMKGIPDAPRCGFSNAVVQVSDLIHIEHFSYHWLRSIVDIFFAF